MSSIVWIWVYMAVLISTIASLGVVFSVKYKDWFQISTIAVAWSLQAILGFLIIQTLGLEMPVLIKQ